MFFFKKILILFFIYIFFSNTIINAYNYKEYVKLDNNIDYKTNKKEIKKDGIKKIITNKQIVLGTYYHGKTLRNIYSLPLWKYNIMNKIGLTDGQKLHYQIINNLECGDENGYCIGENIGPFQINKKVHYEAGKKSLYLINKQKREELYEYQLKWTLNRLNFYKKKLCYGKNEDEVFRCMLKVHNGNNKIVKGTNLRFKDIYAQKGLEIKAFLKNKIKGFKNYY